jgi:hypothetical protein
MPGGAANKYNGGGTPGRPPREAVFERLHIQIGELRDRLGGLPSPVEAKYIWRGIWLEEAHHSTAIEGNTLVLKQVAQLLNEGRAVGDNELREYMEVQGYGNAGNGRTGRLVLNLVLVRLGYPPAIIYKRERTQYLRALRRADRGDFGSLGDLLARAVLDNLYKFVVPAVAGPARLVPLPALAEDELSADALRVAAARGRLEATKGADGTWRSSRVWVDVYKKTRHQRRSSNDFVP